MAGSVLFGRDHEIGVVNALIELLPERGAALLLRGEPGIGKSALLARAASDAADAGVTVLTAAGVQSEAQLPFAGLHQLVRTLLDGVKGLPPVQSDALLGAFGMAGSFADAAVPQFFIIALATLNLLDEASTRGRLLLVVDDAQWLDMPTLDVLGFIARRLGAEPIGLLIGLRDGHAGPLDVCGIPELRLRSLDPAAAEALLHDRAPALAAGARRRVLEAAAGNPLALIELPLALSDDRPVADFLTSTPVPLTARLEEAFASRVHDLPSDTRRLLLVAAADEEGASAEVLAATSVLTGTKVSEQALAPAVEARLLDADELRMSFRHPLVRSAVLQAAPLADRLAAHAALTQVLDGQPDRQAWHRAAATGRRDEAVARRLDEVAARARGRGAITVAVTALERAARLSERASGRGARLLDAAELAFELGHTEQAFGLLRQAEPLQLGTLQRARRLLLRETLEVDVSVGEPRLHLIISTARRAAAEGDPALALRLLKGAAQRCWWTDPGREIRERIVAAVEALPVSELDPDLLYALAAATPLERGTEVRERLDRLAREDGYDAAAAATLGTAATLIGAFDRAAGFLSRAAAEFRAQGRLGLLAGTLVPLAFTMVHTVDWAVGMPAVEEAAQLATENQQPRWLTGAKTAKAQFAALRGDLDTARILAGEAEGAALTTAHHSSLASIQIARGLTSLAAGNPSEAYDCLWRVFAPADPASHPFLRTAAIGDLAEAAVRGEHREAALAELRKLEKAVSGSDAQLIQVNLGYARALLADDEHAEELYRAALDLDMTHWPLARARLMLAYGIWLRRRRRTTEARTPLRFARESFDALGVLPWGERARKELRASGESSERRNPGAWDRLSPQESQIARLAAEGLSNREIGEQLYLSPRTIGAHLYRIFPKLGISSRAQLPDRLRNAD
ncbi:AAA family ATPase [Streptomyces sp. NPDC006923]|uniref:ATP-binding protein n=1 Tax=Streptomyces sp. NPDC006923 TaxID=3155355 RepID=UPI0033E9432C